MQGSTTCALRVLAASLQAGQSEVFAAAAAAAGACCASDDFGLSAAPFSGFASSWPFFRILRQRKSRCSTEPAPESRRQARRILS